MLKYSLSSSCSMLNSNDSSTMAFGGAAGQIYNDPPFPKLLFRDDEDQSEHQAVHSSESSSNNIECGCGNLLSYLYRYYCQKHGVSHASGNVLKQLLQTSELITSVYHLSGVTLHKIEVPRITVLNFDRCYLGGRQLIALADLIGVERKMSGSATISDGSPPQRSFSLLPYLISLSLKDAKLDFYCNEDSIFDLRLAKMYQYNVVPGNSAFGYLFRALANHPALATLDLCENPIGPYLLPRLVQLAKTTPSLTVIDLKHTLLSTTEVQTVAAYCRVNELRKVKSLTDKGADVPHLAVDQSEKKKQAWIWSLRKWVNARQMLENNPKPGLLSLRRSSGNAIRYGIISERFSPYVTAECTPRKMLQVFFYLKDGDSATPTMPCNESEYVDLLSRGVSHLARERDKELSENAEPTKVPPCVTLSALQESLAHALYTPSLLYYLPNEAHVLWSRACVDALRCAFVDPIQAYNTILAGRPVPRGVPGPLTSVVSTSNVRPGPPTQQERAELVNAIANSALVRNALLLLLPPTCKASICSEKMSGRSPHDRAVDVKCCTTCDNQRRQRELLLNKLVDYLVPTIYYGNNVLFEEHTDPCCIFFIPPSAMQERDETGKTPVVRVRLEYILPVEAEAVATATDGGIEGNSVCRTQLQRVLYEEGDFVGETEVLAGTRFYVSSSNRTTSLHPRHPKSMPSFPELSVPKNRISKAVIEVYRDQALASDSVCLWQLPKEVAFFFLHQPFLQIYDHTRAILEYFPTLSSLSPIATIALGYVLESFVVELHGKEILQAPESYVIADNDLVCNNIYFLAKGEYTFSTFTTFGSRIDGMLFGGSVVVSGSAYHDAKMDCGVVAQVDTPQAQLLNVKLGKTHALRQFREAKRWKQRMRDSSKMESIPDDHGSKTRTETGKEGHLSNSGGPPSHGTQRLSLDVLDVYAEENTLSQWKYFALSCKIFLRLPNEVKSAILSACTVVTN